MFRSEDLDEAARIVYRHLAPTPQYVWPLLVRRLGTTVWVKHENHTPIGAFKVRGGLVYLAELRARRPKIGGIVTATRGNHGQSLAYAGRALGIRVTIVVPRGNNPEKNAAMEAFGARLVEAGEDFDAAREHAERLAGLGEGLMAPSFHPDLVRGVATYARELFQAAPDLAVVYAPIGLGSGICGLITVRDLFARRVEIVGVVAERAPCYALSLEAGRPTATASADTVADGLAVRVPDPVALEVMRRGLARVVTVGEEEIREAMRWYHSDTHNLAEGAGAAALAAAWKERDRLRGREVAVVLTGGNVDRHTYREVLARDDR